jgi:cytochrome P450 family 619
LTQDNTINNLLIPKNTTVFLNVWGLHHDPVRHPHPDVFDPERYAGRTLLAPEYAASADFEKRDHYGYGAGRRICPGIHLAERNLFLAIAKLLWAFDFAEIEGAPVDVSARTGYVEGFLHCPAPFRAHIEPRSEARRNTILREFEKAEAEVFVRYEPE